MTSRFRSRRRVRALRRWLLHTRVGPLVHRWWPSPLPTVAAADADVDGAIAGPPPSDADWAPAPDRPASRGLWLIYDTAMRWEPD